MASAANERPPSAPWLRETKPENSDSPIERIPRLRDWLERFGENAAEALSGIFGSGCSGAVDAIESRAAFALLDARLGHPAAVLQSIMLDAPLLMIFDPRIVDI